MRPSSWHHHRHPPRPRIAQRYRLSGPSLAPPVYIKLYSAHANAIARHAQVTQITPCTRGRHATPTPKPNNPDMANAKARPHWRPTPHAAPVGIGSALATNRRTKNNKGERGETARICGCGHGEWHIWQEEAHRMRMHYIYTCQHNRKVVTLTSQSTHHRAQHESDKHTRAILITITKGTCTNHGTQTPITRTCGITTCTNTNTSVLLTKQNAHHRTA